MGIAHDVLEKIVRRQRRPVLYLEVDRVALAFNLFDEIARLIDARDEGGDRCAAFLPFQRAQVEPHVLGIGVERLHAHDHAVCIVMDGEFRIHAQDERAAALRIGKFFGLGRCRGGRLRWRLRAAPDGKECSAANDHSEQRGEHDGELFVRHVVHPSVV